MASHTAVFAQQFAASVGAQDDITLTRPARVVRVTNRGPTDPVFVRLGRNVVDIPNIAAVTDDDCFAVPAGTFREFGWPGSPVCLKVFAASAVLLSVDATDVPIPGI